MKKTAEKLIDEALLAVDPYQLILNRLSVRDGKLFIDNIEEYNLSTFKRIFLIGLGKGAAPMAAAVEELLDKYLDSGCIVVKYDHGQQLQKTEVFEAGHPIPDGNTLIAGRKILDIVDEASENDLVIVLITGGGSALLEALPSEISLDDLAEMNRLMLNSGADITEINTIRKHLSSVKGGRLAKRIAPAATVALILSDVIGDPLQSIASGPTTGDSSTFEESWQILQRYDLLEKIPAPLKKHIMDGLQKKITETPPPQDVVFKQVKNIIIGNNLLALKTLQNRAELSGFHTLVLTDRTEGEARDIGKYMAGMLKSTLQNGIPLSSPACVISGGETTVSIKGKGKGGRNQELVLAALIALANFNHPFYFCSVGTDGTDGPTDAAGAWIDHKTWKKAEEKGLDAAQFLKDNDSYHFFKQIGQLIITGPTRTNVMDVMFFLI